MFHLRDLQTFRASNGTLTVEVENGEPFVPRRAFTVVAPAGAVRGQHAHRECSQFLTVPFGRVLLTVKTPTATREIVLGSADFGLYLPPMVWASQQFLENNTVLLVFCDMDFAEADYIRAWAEYVSIAGGEGRSEK